MSNRPSDNEHSKSAADVPRVHGTIDSTSIFNTTCARYKELEASLVWNRVLRVADSCGLELQDSMYTSPEELWTKSGRATEILIILFED
jgi:hypothetical protein